jgi:hypothetical protein
MYRDCHRAARRGTDKIVQLDVPQSESRHEKARDGVSRSHVALVTSLGKPGPSTLEPLPPPKCGIPMEHPGNE